MKRYGYCLALVMFLVVALSPAVQAQDNRTADEASIRENVKLLETGWNTKSGAMFAKPFAEDADYVVINGMYIKGQPGIENGDRTSLVKELQQKALLTLVMTKEDQGWTIAAFQNTAVASKN